MITAAHEDYARATRRTETGTRAKNSMTNENILTDIARITHDSAGRSEIVREKERVAVKRRRVRARRGRRDRKGVVPKAVGQCCP